MTPPNPPSPSSQELESVRETLVRAVRRICPTWLSAQADDLVQDALLRIPDVLDSSKEFTAPRSSYLWKAAHSAVMDEIRRRRRRREDGDAEQLDAQPDVGPTADQRRSAVDARRWIREGLGHLSEDRRRAVALYLEGYSLKESAELLGWQVKRVDNQRYQGLAELRRFLESKGFKP